MSTIILLATLISRTAVADNLALPSVQGTRVVIDIKKQHVLAKDVKRNTSYNIDNAITRHFIRAEDIQIVANESKPEAQLFILLTREPSRPSAMGQGYCGAGYEDYLLLVEMLDHKLTLRDQFFVQSCLKSMPMFIDHGDDNPSNGLVHEKDGSFVYRLVGDDYDKKRTLIISKKHFEIKMLPPKVNKQTSERSYGRMRYREIYIHSKMLLIDDTFISRGSASLNQRSMSVDSEINFATNDIRHATDLRRRIFRQLSGGKFDGKASAREDVSQTYDSWTEQMAANLKAKRDSEAMTGFLLPLWDNRSTTYRLG